MGYVLWEMAEIKFADLVKSSLTLVGPVRELINEL